MPGHYSARRYWVDWSDASRPRIRLAAEASEGETLMSFTQAKHVVISTLQRQIRQAQKVINEIRPLRMYEVKRGREG